MFKTHSIYANTVKVTAATEAYRVISPYNAKFVEELKSSIPALCRKWDANAKCWYVTYAYGDLLKTLIAANYGTDVELPTVTAQPDMAYRSTFQADYIANPKNGVASVYCDGGWYVKIAEKTLREWFKQEENVSPTLYAVLGIVESSTPLEIKSAYKRSARQWHPDICKEPDAREMFEKIKSAYDVLSEPIARNRYNAGLALEKLTQWQHKTGKRSQFTPNLRCGKLTVTATRELGILSVSEILAWEDITDVSGNTMISFWSGDTFSTVWV